MKTYVLPQLNKLEHWVFIFMYFFIAFISSFIKSIFYIYQKFAVLLLSFQHKVKLFFMHHIQILFCPSVSSLYQIISSASDQVGLIHLNIWKERAVLFHYF